MNVSSSRRLISLSQEFIFKCTIGSLDSLHLAAACVGKADFLLTCDDEILDHGVCIETLASEKGYRLKVRNPVNYLDERRSVKKRQPRK